jgi:superfamily II DNA or RNA helicase
MKSVTQRKSAFLALPAHELDLLACIAAAGYPVFRAQVVGIATAASVKGANGGTKIDAGDLRPFLSRWARDGWVSSQNEREFSHRCHGEAAHWALERAAETGLLRKLQRGLQSIQPANTWGYIGDPQLVMRDIRLHLYQSERREALRLFGELSRRAHDWREAGVLPRSLASLFGMGAPLEAIELLPVEMSHRYLDGCLDLALEGLITLGTAAWSAMQDAVLDVPTLADRAILLAFLRGEGSVCRAMARRMDSGQAAIAEALAAFADGDLSHARMAAIEALRISRGPGERRKPKLEGAAEPWIALLLLTGEDAQGTALARMMMERRQKRTARDRDALEVLKFFGEFLKEGKGPGDSSHIWNRLAYSNQWMVRLFHTTADRWMHVEGPRETDLVDALADMAEPAAENGFVWLARQFEDFGPEGRDANDSGSGLFSLFRRRAGWEHALEALDSVVRASAGTTEGATGDSDRARIRWEVKLRVEELAEYGDDDGFHDFERQYRYGWLPSISVRPRLQRTRGNKWTAGAVIPVSKLLSLQADGLLPEDDVRICQTIIEAPGASSAKPHLSENVGLSLIGHPRVYWHDDSQAEVVRAAATLLVHRGEKNLRVSLSPELEVADAKVQYQRDGNRLLAYSISADYRRVARIVGDGLSMPLAAESVLQKTLGGLAGVVAVQSAVDVEGGAAKPVDADPRPTLQMRRARQGLALRLINLPLGPDGPEVLPGHGARTVVSHVEGVPLRAERDLETEISLLNRLRLECTALPSVCGERLAWVEVESALDCYELLTQLRQIDEVELLVTWPEGQPLSVVAERDLRDLSVKVKGGSEWLHASGELVVDDGLVLDLATLLEKMRQGHGRFIELGAGKLLALSERLHHSLDELASSTSGKKGKVELHPLSLFNLDGWLGEAGEFKCDDDIERRIARIHEAAELEPVVCSTLQAELRDYQKDGYRWLSRLAHWGGGACLADDMGLGKTVQVLTLLLARAEAGPALVVAPKSVCPGWIEEGEKFCPTLNIRQYGEGDRKALLEDLAPYDVVVISYGLMTQDIDELAELPFSSCILDEAQAIKNASTKRAKAVLRLKAECRVVTTGTPIENHLGDIWSQMTFLNPGLLGSSGKFRERFARPIQRDGDAKAAAHLKRILRPFILRRTKSEVLDELPAKTESTLRIEADEKHAALYETIRLQAIESLKGGAKGKQRMRFLAELMRLRRVACHPRLVLDDSSIISAKMETLLELVADLREGGHKALVFSQFVDHLSLVREELDSAKISYQYLDGSTSTKKRSQAISAFQRGEGDLFLISLRAGGFGLNLTAADYVIHLDPWWNPATEDQATDRAHRIGQTRPVTIYKLVMAGTIEEKVLSMHGRKRELAAEILAGSNTSTPLSVEELRGLLDH